MITAFIDHLWQSTLVAAGAALLVVMFRRHAAKVRFWLWLAASMKFLIPFSVLAALGASLEWRSAPPPASEQEWTVLIERVTQPMAVLTAPPQETLPAAAVGPAAGGGVSVATLAVGVWLLGVAVLLGAWLVRWLRLRRLVHLARPLRVDRFTGSIPVKITRSDIEPGVFGIFAPVIVVPEGILVRLSGPQLRAILEHEMCHVRRRDNLAAAVHMLVEALFWFHPLVWWIGARLLDERERACDEAVLAAGINRDAYAEGVLEVCRYCIESPLPCAAGVGGALKSRMERIARDAQPRRLGAARKTVLAGIAAAVLGVPVGIGLLESPRAAAQPADADAVSLTAVAIETIDETASPARSNGPAIRPDGVLIASHVPLRRLIAYAFDIDEQRIAGPPELDSRRYSIKGTGGRRMMQSVLEERFGLVFHRATRTRPIFELVAVPDGAALPNGTPQPGGFVRVRPGGVTFNNVPIDGLRRWLSTRLGRPVVDRTGLTGPYTFTFAWGTAADEDGTSSGEPTPEVLARALESQLGLTLETGEGPVELLVVDDVRQPIDSPPPEGTLRLDAEVLDRYVGFYGVAEIGFIARVERDDEHLVVQVNADRPHAVYPRSEGVFVAIVSDVEIEFVEENGIQALILRNDEVSYPIWGRLFEARARWEPPLDAGPIWGPRLDAATAERLLDDMQARAASQTPIAGGEAIVLRIARVLSGEEPLPAQGGFDPGRAVHDGLERDWPEVFAGRGQLVSVAFHSVDRMGKDVYEIAFENFAIDIVLGLDPAGTLTSVVYRLGAFPIVGGYAVRGPNVTQP
jgi:bla regulator protein blaR1